MISKRTGPVLCFRWISKSDNRVTNIADLVKVRMRRIANAMDAEEQKKSIDDFLKWEMFQGKLKKWFLGLFLLLLYCCI